MGILRLTLAVYVVLGHGGWTGLGELAKGAHPVESFFLISGFYMAMVLSEKYPTPRAVPVFYLNRFLRLYPLYLVVALATWARFGIGWWWLGHPPTLSVWIPLYEHLGWWPRSLLALSNWSMVGLDLPSLWDFAPAHGFLPVHNDIYPPSAAPDGTIWLGNAVTVGVAWSIGMEIWFYLIAPVLVRLGDLALVTLGLASLALRLTVISQGFPEGRLFPAQLCVFILGMLAWRWGPRIAGYLPASRARWGLVAGFVILTFGYPYWRIPGQLWLYDAFMAASLGTIFDLTKKLKWDQWIGHLSYPLYLVHILVFATLDRSGRAPNPWLGLLLSIGCAILLLKLVEQPIDAWRQRRAAQLKAPVAVPA
jgi:peptidoglycan/LPS O-acetylase OafA/YrhL